MKMFKKIKCGLLTGCLVFGLMGQTVLAAENGKYSYTVTLSAGNQGSFAGTESVRVQSAEAKVSLDDGKITITDLKQGDTVALNVVKDGVVSMEQDSKYYVRGVRLSGRDNDNAKTTASAAFTVDEDADYVVAYGIRGDMVAYTVNYRDAQGNTLASSETYYGNVGDKPVVAYHYIEGYQPQAYNLTKTLSNDASENVFTFVYNPAPEDTVTTNTKVITRPGTTAGTGDNAGTDGTAGTVVEVAGTGAQSTADNETTADGEQDTTEIPGEEVPEDTIDLDEEEVPLGNKELKEERPGTTKSQLPLYISIAVAAVLALAGVGVLYFKKLRRK